MKRKTITAEWVGGPFDGDTVELPSDVVGVVGVAAPPGGELEPVSGECPIREGGRYGHQVIWQEKGE